jgi:trigger factor
MKIEVKDAPKSKKELSVELPYESFNKAFDEEYEKVAPTIQIKGFRKGKAPKSVVVKEHKASISSKAVEKLIHESVFKALQEKGINPLNQPDIKDVVFEEDEPITFKVLVDVYPEFNIEKYEGFEFEKEIQIVEDDDVEAALKELQEKNTSFEPAEEGAEVKEGDMVSMDFEGRINGELFEGGSAKGQTIVIGSNTFIPGFEEGMVGMKAGETKDIEVAFPEDYHEKSFAGKKAVFTVTVNEIKNKKVPELNDDFAKDVDEDCETLDDLKNKLRKDLETELNFKADELLFDDILIKIIEENPFELPESMVKDHALRLAEQTLQQYQYMYGMTAEQLGMSKEKLAESMMDRAEMQVKSALILNKIGETEKIEVSDEEVDEKIKEYAEKMKRSFDDYKKEIQQHNGMESIKNNVVTEKLFKLLKEKNTVKEVEYTKEEMQKKVEEQRAKAEAEAAKKEDK